MTCGLPALHFSPSTCKITRPHEDGIYKRGKSSPAFSCEPVFDPQKVI